MPTRPAMSVSVPLYSEASQSTGIRLDRAANACLAMAVFSGGFVIFEPAPYEVFLAGLIGVFFPAWLANSRSGASIDDTGFYPCTRRHHLCKPDTTVFSGSYIQFGHTVSGLDCGILRNPDKTGHGPNSPDYARLCGGCSSYQYSWYSGLFRNAGVWHVYPI